MDDRGNAIRDNSCCWSYSTLCLKKGHTFKLAVTLSNLNRFSKFLTTGKRIKVVTKPIRHYPPHLRYIATLPWEIKDSNFLQMWKNMQKSAFLIASNFVILPKIVIFSVFKIASLSSYWLQIKFFRVTVLVLIYFCDQFVASEIHRNRRHCSICQQPTWYSATRTRFW